MNLECSSEKTNYKLKEELKPGCYRQISNIRDFKKCWYTEQHQGIHSSN